MSFYIRWFISFVLLLMFLSLVVFLALHYPALLSWGLVFVGFVFTSAAIASIWESVAKENK